MKKDASKDFKNAVDKAFTTQPNVKLNSSTMKDAMNLKQQFKEQDELEGGMGDDMTLKKLSKKHGVSLWEIVSQFDMGVEVEREHTNDLKKEKVKNKFKSVLGTGIIAVLTFFLITK